MNDQVLVLAEENCLGRYPRRVPELEYTTVNDALSAVVSSNVLGIGRPSALRRSSLRSLVPLVPVAGARLSQHTLNLLMNCEMYSVVSLRHVLAYDWNQQIKIQAWVPVTEVQTCLDGVPTIWIEDCVEYPGVGWVHIEFDLPLRMRVGDFVSKIEEFASSRHNQPNLYLVFGIS